MERNGKNKGCHGVREIARVADCVPLRERKKSHVVIELVDPSRTGSVIAAGVCEGLKAWAKSR